MTAAIVAIEPPPRWAIELLVVLGAHAVLVAVLLRSPTAPPVAAPPAAILIDLPAAPPTSSAAAEPALDLPVSEMPKPVAIDIAEVDLPVPEMPEPVAIDVPTVGLPPPEMPSAVVIEVPELALPPPQMPAPVTIPVAQVELPMPDEPQPLDLASMIEPARPAPPLPLAKPRRQPVDSVRRQARTEPAQAPSAVPASPPQVQSNAAQPTAPVRAPTRSLAPSVPTWQSAVLAHLEQHKRYPRQARFHHQEGTATVRFTVDCDGRVDRITLLATSGQAALDEETLALLQRASPLPAPPAEAGQPPLTLAVPVQYSLR